MYRHTVNLQHFQFLADGTSGCDGYNVVSICLSVVCLLRICIVAKQYVLPKKQTRFFRPLACGRDLPCRTLWPHHRK